MPKKEGLDRAKQAKSGATAKFSDVVFISYPHDAEMLSAIKKLSWTLDDVDTELSDLNDSDYKVTFSFDAYNECYSCFIIPVGEAHPNRGFILTGRGSAPWKALRQAAYTHNVLFQRDWTSWQDRRRNHEIDD